MTEYAETPELDANPYPGLRPFETEEDYLFFGRDGQSEEILARLRRQRMVAVVGTSGSGKSSLIRAGLLPYVYGGFMSGAGSHWRVAVMRPGGDPIRNLARALYVPSVLARPEATEEEARQEGLVLEMTLRRSGLGLVEAVRQAQLPKIDNVLVVVDQFEELFRYAETSKSLRNEDDAAAFVKLLLESTAQTTLPIYVVLTMRSDFIGDCARYRDLPEAVTAGLYLIPRMTRDQRREAIERPALVAGSTISSRLMNRLLNDGGDSPDQLPILQHALMRTWDYWRKHDAPEAPIDLDDYKAIGELSEALSLHAEEAYAELPDDRSREIAKRMFQALTEKGEDNREIRRPTSVATIAAIAGASGPEVIAVIEYFRKSGRSFLTPPANVPLTETSVIDISHESLIRGWTRLNKWVDEETESAKVYHRLAETAALQAQGRAALWQGPDLANALAWREKEKPNQQWGRCYHPGFDTAMVFLDRSAKARTQKRMVFAALACCLALWSAYLFYSHEVNLKRSAAQAKQSAEQEKELLATEAEIQKNKLDEAATQAKMDEVRLKAAQAELHEAELNAEAQQAEEQTKQSQSETEWVRNVVRTGDVSRISIASDASELTSRLNEVVPQSEKVLTGGEFFAEMGQHDKAAEAYTAALRMRPEQYGIHAERAYEYILLGRASDAIADLNTYLKYDPHDYVEEVNLSIAHSMLKDYKDAGADIQSAIRDFQFGASGMYDSEIAPDILRATGQSRLVATPVTFYVTMFYEAATLKAFAGDPDFAKSLDRADQVARSQGFELPASGAAPKSTNGSVDPFIVAIEWAWLSARSQDITRETANHSDYGVYAAYGALWERAGRIQPRFKDWAGHFYAAFEEEHRKQREPRYDQLASWVNERLHVLYPKSGRPPDIKDETVPDADVLADKASVLEARKDYAGAATELTEAIQQVEHSPGGRSQLIMLLVRRAGMYVYTGNDKGVQEDCRRVLELEPHTAMANLYLAFVDKDAAAQESHYRKALEYDPRLRWAKVYLARLVEGKDPEQALELLREADQLGPPNASIFREIALVQILTKSYADALVSVDRAIALEPTEMEAYDIKDKAEEGLGRSSADRLLDQASAYRRLGEYLAKSGHTDEAMATYLRTLRLLASDPANKETDSVRAEETVTAHDLSQMVEGLSSRADARQFWVAVSATAYLKPIGGIAQSEVKRLSSQ